MVHVENDGQSADDFDTFWANAQDALPSTEEYKQMAFGVVAPPPDLAVIKNIQDARVFFYDAPPEKKDPGRHLPLRLSDVGAIMYLARWKNNEIPTPTPKQFEVDESQKAITQGVVLHQLDALFRSVMMGNIGIGVVDTFPTHKKKDLASYIDATRLSRVRPWLTKEELATEFRLVATTLLYGTTQREGFHIEGDLPFFPKMKDPSKMDAVLHSAQTNEEIAILADAWAEAILHPDTLHWEFIKGTKSYREVFIVINLSNGLQVKVQFDSMTRFIDPRGKVVIQIADLKTGKTRIGTPLDEEIKKREAQVMLMAAERLTSYMVTNARGKYSIRDYIKGGSIVFGANHTNRAHTGRAQFYYRRLNRQKRVFEFEHVEMASDDIREEFENWFTDLGVFFHKHEDEVKRHIKRVRAKNK